MSWAQEARFSLSGMTSLGNFLFLNMHRRCCLQHFLPLSRMLWLPPLVLSRYPAASLGRSPPWRMKLQCLALVEAFLLGVSTAASTRLPPSESVLASLHLPAWSSVHS